MVNVLGKDRSRIFQQFIFRLLPFRPDFSQERDDTQRMNTQFVFYTVGCFEGVIQFFPDKSKQITQYKSQYPRNKNDPHFVWLV